MAAGNTPELGPLLAHVANDPIGMAGRVLQQTMDRLASDEAIAGNGEMAADELVAAALGNRLARFLTDRNDEADDYAELAARDAALAAALGACECWGADADCPACGGAGEPGWMLPDSRLFAHYVHPAVQAVIDSGTPPPGINDTSNDTSNDDHQTSREGNRHGRHMAQ
jgi:hypothetical protein